MNAGAGRSPSGVYAIVDGAYVAPERMRRVAAALAEGGVRWIQLRMKGAFARDLHAVARDLATDLAGSDVTLLVNDRSDVALVSGANGVHVGQDDLPPELARQILGPERIVGLSTHTVAEAQAARTAPIDYVGVGPVFASGTKSGHAAVLGLDGLRAVVEASAHPAVAIGGVTLERVPELRRAGAASVAMIAALLQAGDIRARAEEAVGAWQEGA